MYIIQTDKRLKAQIRFLGTKPVPGDLDVYCREFYRIPDLVTFVVDVGEYTVLPDIFVKPFPMVSEMVMEVMELYRIQLPFRRVVLSARNSGEYRRYFLVCPDEDTETIFRDFQLRRAGEDTIQCTASLDFVESILRRGGKGIEIMRTGEREGGSALWDKS